MVKDIWTFFEIIDKKVHISESVQSDTTLRPYQKEAKKNVWEGWKSYRRLLLQMPTGAGKTRLFVSVIRDIRQLNPSARVLIVTHRTELVEQISQTLTEHYSLEHSIQGKGIQQQDILIASIQMLSRRLKNGLDLQADYIIIDEAHHSLAPGYQLLWKAFPKAFFLGVTATPYRLHKASFEALYDRLIVSCRMRELIKAGWLAQYKLFTVSSHHVALTKINRLTTFGADGDYRQKDLQEILYPEEEIDFLYQCYERYTPGKKGIIYAVNQAHAASIATYFKTKGIKAAAIDCKTPKGERRRLVEDFKNGRGVDILVNVELFTEGFDCPAIAFVMLARPTLSLTMYLQQVGRSLRPSPDKAPVFILDCTGLYHRFGRPDRDRDWEGHFKGLKLSQEDYSKRPLGETEAYPLLRTVEQQVVSKPKDYEILPPEYGISRFRMSDGTGKWGLMDSKGKVVCKAEYDELGRTPFGWYIGVVQYGIVRYMDIIDLRHDRIYSFSSIRRLNDITYEATVNQDKSLMTIRFNGLLRLIPLQVITVNNITFYLISNTGRKVYSLSLKLDAPYFFSYEAHGDKYVLFDYDNRSRQAFITDGTSLKRFQPNSQL